MKLYTVGYGSYEDSSDVTLLHEKEFTEAEFDKMAISAAIEVVRRRVDKSDGEWLHSFDGIYSEVAKVMCEFYGFEVAKFAGSYNVFGWPSMFDMTDWSEQRGEKLNELTRALNAAGFTKEHDTYLTDREERRLEYERERKKNEDQNAQPGDGTQIEGSLGDLQEGPDNGLPQEQGQGG